MGRENPDRPLQAARDSGSFSPISLDLYELILFSPTMASVSAIASKPHLMALQNPRAKLATPEPSTDQIAAAVREAIRDACKLLAARDQPGVDKPTAARTLLGLEAGYENAPRSVRRQRAASALRRPSSGFSKTRYKSERPGKYAASPELVLLDEVARQVFDREFAFLQSNNVGVSQPPATDSPSYAVLYETRRRLKGLTSPIAWLYLGQYNRSKHDVELADDLLYRWWCVKSAFDAPEQMTDWEYDVPLDDLDAPTLVTIMYEFAPAVAFDSWAQNIRLYGYENRDRADLTSESSWLTDLFEWLDRCRCQIGSKPASDCPVHVFAGAASSLIQHIEREWQIIANATMSPDGYGEWVKHESLLAKLPLNIDTKG